MIDVAIIGAGVSGCYCAHRLAQDAPHLKVRLFEMSARVGGRLMSHDAAGIEGLPMEFGGMFFAEQHQNVYSLVKHLGFQPRQVLYVEKHQFLRGRDLVNSDYTDSARIPYFLRNEEFGKAPYALLIDTIKATFPSLKAMWPFAQGGDASATALFLRAVTFEERPLYMWGFWNFLSKVASNEAYEFMLTGTGCSSTVRNSNAYDAIWGLLCGEGAGAYYQIAEGYQRLPERLVGAVGVKPKFGFDLKRVKATPGGVKLKFRDGESVEAKGVILALPSRALERIDLDSALGEGFNIAQRNAVIAIPASKLFLAFQTPWWREARFAAELAGTGDVAASYTDLPLRACYYFGNPDADERALLLASYADEEAESFWKGLGPGSDVRRFPSLIAGAAPQTLSATVGMVDAAMDQLRLMHGRRVTEPLGANFVDWGADPYGAGWHAWAASHRSWVEGKQMRQPDPTLPIFICGEAFAQLQGWSEGAVNTAEMLLRESFGLKPAAWIPSGYDVEI